MEIVTLAYNRPDFIELQLNSLKKWTKDFTYTVYDNAPDDSIKDECARLGITCIPIKVFSEDPSWAVGISLNKMWDILKGSKGKLWYIDHDMFLVAPLPQIEADMAFVPQIRGEYMYPWTGLMYFNIDSLENKDQIDWAVDYSLKDTDVGGRNHYYLEYNKPKVQELEMWTLIDRDKYSYNGVDSNYNHIHGEMWVLAEKYHFPRPYSFDLFNVKDGKPFIFHYKSASGYPSFMIPQYVDSKTKALVKLLSF